MLEIHLSCVVIICVWAGGLNYVLKCSDLFIPLPDDKIVEAFADDKSIGECNTILNAYILYRLLG